MYYRGVILKERIGTYIWTPKRINQVRHTLTIGDHCVYPSTIIHGQEAILSQSEPKYMNRSLKYPNFALY